MTITISVTYFLRVSDIRILHRYGIGLLTIWSLSLIRSVGWEITMLSGILCIVCSWLSSTMHAVCGLAED